jgi:hypothetical protein
MIAGPLADALRREGIRAGPRSVASATAWKRLGEDEAAPFEVCCPNWGRGDRMSPEPRAHGATAMALG